MKKLPFCVLAVTSAWATPVPLINPSLEINNGSDGTLISDPSVLGWEGTGILSEGDTDYGNGRWKVLYDDSSSATYLTSHRVEPGSAYSIRFDAALNPDTTFIPPNAIIGGALLNGDFNADTSETSSRSFNNTPNWTNLAGNQALQATTLAGTLPAPDNSRNALISDSPDRVLGIDPNYTLTGGQKLELSFQWRDGLGWDDQSDQIRATLFVTNDDSLEGTPSDLISYLSGTSANDSTYQDFKITTDPIPAGAGGKKLFLRFEGVDGNSAPTGTANLDNVILALFNPLLVGPNVRNGNFNDDTTLADKRTFSDTPFWINLTGNQNYECTRTNILFDGTRCAVLRNNGNSTPIFANDPEYRLETGDILSVSFRWRDAFNWDDAADRAQVFIYTTGDGTPTGTRTVLQTLTTPASSQNNAFQLFTADFNPIPASAAGKRVFVAFTSLDGNNDNQGYGRIEDFQLSVNESDPAIPPTPPPAPSGDLIVEAYVDNNGNPLPIASRIFSLTSQRVTRWNHYHLAIPAGTIDPHAGKEIGIRFRSPGSGDSLSRYIDNLRFAHYPDSLPSGDFSNNWNSSPNRVWVGPGYWGNRLQDWEVRNGRINCILNTSKARRTLHRIGTSIRGNGGDFTLDVRTGLHSGTIGFNSRTGFLIGAGPNLDWRASMLVHDGLGRDFGTFLGIDNNGTTIIEDLSEGSIIAVAQGANPGSFPTNGRLRLTGLYDIPTGNYTLTIQSLNAGGGIISQTSVTVPSQRILGSFGLLSNRGNTNANFWFDDFSASGTALNDEPDRNLAIVGSLYTLNRGTLTISAHLSAVDRATTPPVTFETWNGTAWIQRDTATIDNTDNLSSYTATFTLLNWDVTRDTPYRLGVQVDGESYHWHGTIRKDPVDKEEIVVINTSCQRAADESLEADVIDWSPLKVWHPHKLAYDHIAKQGGDVLLALGDQIYEGQPTSKDTSSNYNRHHDYLYKWQLWLLQARELAREMPTISIPDDHDIYQGNLWGENGIATTDQRTGGYEQPAAWVRLVERTQASHLPLPDPYNPVQPALSVNQGIGVYFTELSYGEIGFAVLEDRKFKTGPINAPSDPDQQFLLGQRQKDFLRVWSTDWHGQQMKCVVSQSPFGMIHTHAAEGYGYFINDRDANGWPVHRRDEAWELLRLTRSFQLAGDQHLSSLVHHGIDTPADAGYSFTSPAIANFFPRVWDPVHNASGRTGTVSPYTGDFFLDGNGTLPSGEQNLNSTYPSHIRVVSAANPLEYYDQTRNMSPANLHDRGAGYGIIRIQKSSRRITFESWPLHADPEYPQTGSQFPDWPVTINQTDNDGRRPTGFLPLINTLAKKEPVVSVYDETTGNLIYSMRFAGTIVRLPVYDNSLSYRVDISYDNDSVSEIRTNQSASPAGPVAIHSFTALHPSIISGDSTLLQWNTESPTLLTIDNGIGNVSSQTVNGVGQLSVSPAVNTTYTLTVNGGLTAQTTVLVFPTKIAWLGNYFTLTELNEPTVSSDNADADGDGFSNLEEFRFQTDPRDNNDTPSFISNITEADDLITVKFTSAFPLQSEQSTLRFQTSSDLETWTTLGSNSYQEVARDSTGGKTQISIRFNKPSAAHQDQFYRAIWEFKN